MVKKKSFKILFLLIILILFNIPMSLAKSEITVTFNKENIQVGEDVGLKINIANVDIASFTLEIYFNETNLEYIGGPDNSNYSNGRILYTWVSENGENKSNIDMGTFLFKGKEDGVSNIVVTGEFYNSEGKQIQLENGKKEIRIGVINAQNQEEQIAESNLSDNTNLSILRINEEGISPDFSPDIKEYYFIADKNINKLEVTAIPENPNAVVTITGNDNFIIGKNTIDIKVESEDKTKIDIYRIFVTRAENIEMANANLETLAIRQATLNPEFDNNVTYYKAEIANDINKIDILAITQKENATVKIIGNDEMQIGLNKIEITVTAEDGITDKKYVLEVYRRNEEEEIKAQEKQKIEAEKLSAILEENQNNNGQNAVEEDNNQDKIESEDEKIKNNIRIGIWIIAEVIVVIGIGFYFRLKRRK